MPMIHTLAEDRLWSVRGDILTVHICGAGLAFLGFSVSMFIGLWVENPFVTIVGRSTLVLFLFYILGCILASLGNKVIEENFKAETEAISAKRENKDESSPENIELGQHSKTTSTPEVATAAT